MIKIAIVGATLFLAGQPIAAAHDCADFFKPGTYTITYETTHGPNDVGNVRSFSFRVQTADREGSCRVIRAGYENWKVTGTACENFNFSSRKAGEGVKSGSGSCSSNAFHGAMGYTNGNGESYEYDVEIK